MEIPIAKSPLRNSLSRKSFGEGILAIADKTPIASAEVGMMKTKRNICQFLARRKKVRIKLVSRRPQDPLTHRATSFA